MNWLRDFLGLLIKLLKPSGGALAAPVTDLLYINQVAYLGKLAEYGISSLLKADILDAKVTLTSKSELDRIAPYLVYPANWYIAEIWDCDNYGIQAMNDAARLFHVSGACLALGYTDFGYHGFLIVLDTDSSALWVLEPNAGYPWAGRWRKPSDIKYTPIKVFI